MFLWFLHIITVWLKFLDEERASNWLPTGYLWDLITKSDKICTPVKLHGLILSRGNAKIVTDSQNSGRKAGDQGGKKEEEAGQESWVALQEIKQVKWALIDCSHSLVLSPKTSFALITSGYLPKPTLHVGHMLCSIKIFEHAVAGWLLSTAIKGWLPPAFSIVQAFNYAPCPLYSCSFSQTLFILRFHLSNSVEIGSRSFLRGIAECTER